MTARIQFLGAADTVTGSRYLVEAEGTRFARRLRALPGLQEAARAKLGTAFHSIRQSSMRFY